MTSPRCRWCRSANGALVLDLGEQPPADHFPARLDPGPDAVFALRMWLCAECGLAQLAEDETKPDEPRGVEPAALVEQAADAVRRAAPLLPAGGTVREYGSPHGGSWLSLLEARGLVPAANGAADVLVDCFGLMHEADQKAALLERVSGLADDGVFLLQFHSLASILREGQWSALRHGHYAYYSTPVLVEMLRAAGLVARSAFRFELYGGTVLLAAARGGAPDDSVRALVEQETDAGVARPEVVAGLQEAAVRHADSLRRWLEEQSSAGHRVLGYGAASRAVAQLCRAGITTELLPAIADASDAKQGRRMPGSGIPIVPPAELAAFRPDAVVLFLPDLLAEVRRSIPEVEAAGGRWVPADVLENR
ncbi:class I SAM-dependent methyltransferase [Amycolatopsis benzoatilytica]|uniref:class I SAM-dependent methyltransferase n=1 Tax=Amycolatopsis benzoatilytica TaxID=346045 RepID=UPI000378489F|nr:class I SAM-dependent methyltransferase [Amycolatopsis benzoatilytica]